MHIAPDTLYETLVHYFLLTSDLPHDFLFNQPPHLLILPLQET